MRQSKNTTFIPTQGTKCTLPLTGLLCQAKLCAPLNIALRFVPNTPGWTHVANYARVDTRVPATLGWNMCVEALSLITFALQPCVLHTHLRYSSYTTHFTLQPCVLHYTFYATHLTLHILHFNRAFHRMVTRPSDSGSDRPAYGAISSVTSSMNELHAITKNNKETVSNARQENLGGVGVCVYTCPSTNICTYTVYTYVIFARYLHVYIMCKQISMLLKYTTSVT